MDFPLSSLYYLMLMLVPAESQFLNFSFFQKDNNVMLLLFFRSVKSLRGEMEK